ncbi:MAG: hypothetical protein AAB074_19415 [Planctomycetota bacterium]
MNPQGRGFAWVIGAVVAATSILAGSLTVNHGDSRGQSLKRDRGNSLKQLGIYFALYEGKYKRYPPSVEDLQRGLDLASGIFACPRCGKSFTPLFDAPGTYTPTGGATYSWTESGISDGAPPDLPLAFCEGCRADGGDTAVLFFQGRVDVFAVGSPTENVIMDLAIRRQAWRSAHPSGKPR